MLLPWMNASRKAKPDRSRGSHCEENDRGEREAGFFCGQVPFLFHEVWHGFRSDKKPQLWLVPSCLSVVFEIPTMRKNYYIFYQGSFSSRMSHSKLLFQGVN